MGAAKKLKHDDLGALVDQLRDAEKELCSAEDRHADTCRAYLEAFDANRSANAAYWRAHSMALLNMGAARARWTQKQDAALVDRRRSEEVLDVASARSHTTAAALDSRRIDVARLREAIDTRRAA